MRQIQIFLLRVVGVLLILLGVVGLFLPFLQGFLFMAAGVYALMLSSERFRQWVKSYTIKSPRFHTLLEKAEQFIKRIFPH